MKDMILEINNHKEKNDIVVCYELINYIMDNKINSVDGLRKIEEQKFTTKDINKRLEDCYNSYLQDYGHLEELDQNEMDVLLTNAEKYEKSNNLEEKMVCIVRMYIVLGWGIYFPYSTYKLILEDKIN